MDDLISKLSEIRSDYNCFNEDEEPQYRALSEAIRILSQRADGDTISRQAAIDCVTCDVEHTIECLKALPPAAPTTTQTTETTAPTTEATAPTTDDWIPCSERLPKDGRCLVTRFDFITNTCFLDILWYEKGVWWNRLYTGDFAVIAWMPLPEPYRGNM